MQISLALTITVRQLITATAALMSNSSSSTFADYWSHRNASNLQDIIWIWNRLNESRSLLIPTAVHGGWAVGSENLADIKDGTPVESAPSGSVELETLTRQALMLKYKDVRLTPLSVTLYNQATRKGADDKTLCYLLEGLNIVVRAECFSQPISLEELLTDSFPRHIDIPPVGNFSHSFPDVADLSKDLTKLSLQDLQTVFHNEMNKSGETIELPGVKLPAEAVTNWGIVIIIMLEGYFFVVFREFTYRVRQDDKAWNVPWIGISSDNISSAAFVASILMVLAAVSFLAWNGLKPTSTIWMVMLYGMGFTGTVAFVVVTILLRRRAFLSVAGQAVAADSWLC